MLFKTESSARLRESCRIFMCCGTSWNVRVKQSNIRGTDQVECDLRLSDAKIALAAPFLNFKKSALAYVLTEKRPFRLRHHIEKYYGKNFTGLHRIDFYHSLFDVVKKYFTLVNCLKVITMKFFVSEWRLAWATHAFQPEAWLLIGTQALYIVLA